jgi:hypothetical protein
MRYGITRLVLGKRPFIEIDEQRYRAVVQAKERLIQVIGIEEKFDLLLENLADLERDLLQLNLNQLLFKDQDWHGFRSDTRLLARRLSNLLSSAKLYIDQTKHELSDLLGASALAELESRFSSAYDSSLSYRLMEALRNYFQHRGIPVSSVSYKSQWHHDAEPPVMEHRAGLTLDVEMLKEDAKFKRSVLEEFRARGEKANVIGDIRSYVAALAEIHEWLREILSDSVKQWEAELQSVIDISKKEFPDGHIVGLGVAAMADNGTCPEHEQVFENLLKYRRFFARKNSILRHLGQRYVSSLGLPGGDA